MAQTVNTVNILLTALEVLISEQTEYGNDAILNEPPIDRDTGIEVLRHAIIHLVDRFGERRWPSAVPEE